MRRTWFAAAALSVGAGLLLVSTSLPERAPARPGPVRPLDPSALEPRDIRAQNSPVVVRDPRHPSTLAVANRVDTPRLSCSLHVSSDAGATWADVAVPQPDGEEPKCFAPTVVFGADGTLSFLFVTLQGLGNVPHAVWLASSPPSDPGRALSAPRRVLGPLAFQVGLVADPTAATLYVTWVQAGEVGRYSFASTSNPIQSIRSDDGGRTWSPPVRVSPPSRLRPLAPSPAIAAGGRLYVAYLDVGDDLLDYQGAHGGNGGAPYQGAWKLVVARSADGGAHWTETEAEPNLAPSSRFIVFIPPTPSIVVGGDGRRVYVGFSDGRLGDADVAVWSSRDGGMGWARHRVNDTRPADGTSQYLAALALAPSGRLDVVYYDRRDDSRDEMTQVSFQSSFDGGASFTPSRRVSDRPFDGRVGFGSERGMPDLGSRLGLLSGERTTLAFWTDTRAGTEASNKQDIAFATVTVGGRGRPAWIRWGLAGAGSTVVLAGLAITVVALVRRRAG